MATRRGSSRYNGNASSDQLRQIRASSSSEAYSTRYWASVFCRALIGVVVPTARTSFIAFYRSGGGADHPHETESAAPVAARLHQRTGAEHGALKPIMAQVGPEPVIAKTFTCRNQHLRARIAARRFVCRARGSRIPGCHTVKIGVVLPLRIDRTGKQAEVPAARTSET